MWNNTYKTLNMSTSREKLVKFIRSEYGTCENMREKIQNEGTEYFYNSYTTVPVSYEDYMAFANSEECYCGWCERFIEALTELVEKKLKHGDRDDYHIDMECYEITSGNKKEYVIAKSDGAVLRHILEDKCLEDIINLIFVRECGDDYSDLDGISNDILEELFYSVCHEDSNKIGITAREMNATYLGE